MSTSVAGWRERKGVCGDDQKVVGIFVPILDA
jgi:hypothetical protein